MPNLNEISQTHLKILEHETWNNKLTCALTNKQLTMLSNELTGALNWYSFTLVTEGHIILDNGAGEMIFTPNEMFVFYPGSPIYIYEASEDYKGICLICDQQMALDTQAFRNLIKASIIPISNYGNSKVTLTHDDATRLLSLMLLIRQYIMQPLQLKGEILEHLYSVFINDLISIQSFEKTRLYISRQSEEIFISFYTLLTRNYLEHRDLKFYADRLFGLQFVEFFLHLFPYVFLVLPVESHITGLLLNTIGFNHRRQSLRHSAQHTLVAVLFLQLNLLPRLLHLLGCIGRSLPINMRMTENQLVSLFVANVCYIKIARFFADFRIEHNVHNNIPELLADVPAVVLHQRVTKFVHLFNSIRAQALVRLFPIPRTFFPQSVQHVEQSPKRFQFFFSSVHFRK